MEEEEKVFEVDFVVGDPFGQIEVHQVQNIDFSFRHLLTTRVQIDFICCIASGGSEIGLAPPMQPPIVIKYSNQETTNIRKSALPCAPSAFHFLLQLLVWRC